MENAYLVGNGSAHLDQPSLGSDELYRVYGHVRDPLYVVIPISVMYASIFVTGTIGNVSTCVVIARNKSMHTATNYYLFSLAVSDLLLLVCGMPAEMYSVWSKYPYVFGEAFCVLRGVAAETSTNASVLTITAFTAERYVAICHPFLSHTMSKLSRAVKLILFIWLVAMVCAVPQALQFGLIQVGPSPDSVMCSFKKVIIRHSFELSTFVFFVVPMTLIMALYILIGVKLKKSTMSRRSGKPQLRKSDSSRLKVGSSRMDRHCRHTSSTRRVLKMLVAVVVAFFICWAPFHMQRLIAIYGKSDFHAMGSHDWVVKLYLIFTYVSGVLYYFSTTINPILYNIMSNKFREAFMETLARSCRMSGLVKQRERRSYSSLSRSQQRMPGNCPSRTTGISVATAMAQESTDCSGNSYREDVVELPMSEPPLVYSVGQTKGSAEESAADKGSPLGLHFVELQLDKGCSSPSSHLPSPHYDGCIRIKSSSGTTTTTQQPQNKRANPSVGPRRKWWRLLDWLPGLKSLGASRVLARPSQGNGLAEVDPRPTRPDDYLVQLHTFKAKDESCRPV